MEFLTLLSRFAALRVRPAQGDHRRSEPRSEHWLLVRWPQDEVKPRKLWLSTLPGNSAISDLVHMAKHRWLIERDYQELKQELGLGHYEGRGWPRFQHHAALWIAAYGFLAAERAAIPPPLSNRYRLAASSACPFRKSPTPRRRHCAPSATCRTAQRRYDGASYMPSP